MERRRIQVKTKKALLLLIEELTAKVEVLEEVTESVLDENLVLLDANVQLEAQVARLRKENKELREDNALGALRVRLAQAYTPPQEHGPNPFR